MIRVRVRVNFKIQENTKLQKSENSNSPYKNVTGMVRKICTCHVLCILRNEEFGRRGKAIEHCQVSKYMFHIQ